MIKIIKIFFYLDDLILYLIYKSYYDMILSPINAALSI